MSDTSTTTKTKKPNFFEKMFPKKVEKVYEPFRTPTGMMVHGPMADHLRKMWQQAEGFNPGSFNKSQNEFANEYGDLPGSMTQNAPAYLERRQGVQKKAKADAANNATESASTKVDIRDEIVDVIRSECGSTKVETAVESAEGANEAEKGGDAEGKV